MLSFHLNKIFKLVPELKNYYNLYQLLLFHLQKKNIYRFFGFIHEALPHLNHTFKTVLNIFIRYYDYMELLPYSNAKLEATNKLIKNTKHHTFGYRKFENFKKRIYLALNTTKEKTKLVLSRC